MSHPTQVTIAMSRNLDAATQVLIVRRTGVVTNSTYNAGATCWQCVLSRSKASQQRPRQYHVMIRLDFQIAERI